MNRKTVLLVFGGQSSEHEVSIMSARNVYAAMDDTRYEVLLCYIDTAGTWRKLDDWSQLHSDESEGDIVAVIPGQQQLQVVQSGERIAIDILFPMLHGVHGEDGTIQGVATMLGVPYVGPSLLGAAVTMDKVLTKTLLQAAGIAVVPWEMWQTAQDYPHYDNLTAKLGDRLFVKPVAAGSSVGVSRVEQKEQFIAALDAAAEHDTEVLIERAIEATELEVAVLGSTPPEVARSVGEVVSSEGHYDYEAKYSANSTTTIRVPATVDDTQIEEARRLALQAYRATAGRGMARVDFFLEHDTNKLYVNEINSIPGFTNTSMYPKIWHTQGVTYGQLIDKLIADALK